MTVTSPINIVPPKRNSSTLYPNQACPISHCSRDTEFSMSPVMNSSSMPKYGSSVGSTTTKPISMPSPNQETRPRRDSLAGSLTSWSGYSIGSWIRDDAMMTGTSPYTYQLSSFNSSSFLPLLEDKYLRDFACCGSTIPSLHDLLQHYETTHVHLQTPQSLRASYVLQRPRENSRLNNKRVGSVSPTPTASQQPISHHHPQNLATPQTNQHGNTSTFSATKNLEGIEFAQLNQLQKHEYPDSKYFSVSSPARNISSSESEVDEMELDDGISTLEDMPETPPRPSHLQLSKSTRQSVYGQLPELSLDLSSTTMQYSGFRNSQPPTPASAGFSSQNNPTVSSVNTPTLSAQPMSHSQSFTPMTSGPGTPLDIDESESLCNSAKICNETMNQNLSNFPYHYPLGWENTGNGYCIDEPAKRLYSPNGFNSLRLQQLKQLSQMQGDLFHSDAMLQAQHMQQTMVLGHPHPTSIMMASEEHKPFRCPVIGCEKAYKNQNGLKYHKTHGHSTQQLHENGDGTFSIINPETSTPYPGTLGMEKEKPYKCDNCSKRYKNLNGLKYHKQHSPSCNPELQFNNHMSATSKVPLAMNLSGPCRLEGLNMVP